MKHMNSAFAVIATIVGLAGIFTMLDVPLRAAMAAASGWAGPSNGRVRLIGGDVANGPGPAALYAGIHMKMDEGWKTYWRTPGEAGVPPNFDWAGSTNVKSARVLYPAPHRYRDAGLESIGYKGEVMFPVEITPLDVNVPVDLKLAVTFGVCKDICIPVDASLAVTIKTGQAAGADAAAAIGAFLAQVPRRDEASNPRLVKVTAALGAVPPRLTIDALFPNSAEGADLFIEADDGGYVPLPTRVASSAGGAVRFEVNLGTPEDAKRLAGRELTLTFVGSAGQSERVVRLP